MKLFYSILIIVIYILFSLSYDSMYEDKMKLKIHEHIKGRIGKLVIKILPSLKLYMLVKIIFSSTFVIKDSNLTRNMTCEFHISHIN